MRLLDKILPQIKDIDLDTFYLPFKYHYTFGRQLLNEEI